jgi:hypothetical protein
MRSSGALSISTGSIDIVCSEDGGQFVLTWTEHGGPPLILNPRLRALARSTVQGPLKEDMSRDWDAWLRLCLTVGQDRILAKLTGGGERDHFPR